MNSIFKRSAASLAVLLSIYVIVPPSISAAATKVDLSTASSFGVLGALGVANVGPTVITGTAGNMVGTTGAIIVTGFPPGTAGAIHNNDAMATSAMASANLAETATQSQPSVAHTLVPSESVGPGAYALGTLPVLVGALTLNGGGDVNSVFIFITNDAFTTATSSAVNLINGAQAANVFWRIGGTATLGANSKFAGHLIASSTVTALTGAAIVGSLISRTGAVSLNSNAITNDLATPVVPPVVPPVVTPPAPVPPVSEENSNLPGTKGTINVITIVNNTYGGTATPGDFTLALRHHAVDVLGSPAVGMAAPGRAYLVNPGTYVLMQEVNTMFPDYIQSFDIVGQSTQTIVLAPGQSITITETNNQLPPLTAPGTEPTPPPPPTVTGGTLPKTGSPWYNFLLLGVVGMALSGAVLGFRKSSKI